MTESEHTCRICRGEASVSQPLIHPCRCRGLIKYIHQECLLEWLEHLSNRGKKCDICNTPYRFVTLYDPNMPSSMPWRDICAKVLLLVKSGIVRYISAFLYLLCVCQVPVYWKFVGRLCTYAVDGKMPSPSFSLFHVMAYGAYSHTRNGHLFSSSDTTFSEKFLTFLCNTYFSGTFQVLVCMLVLFVVFIEREWVVREEGYTKLLLRRIGREPRTKLADLLTQIVQNQGGNPGNPTPTENGVENAPENAPESTGNNARETMAARALEYIQEDAHASFPGNNLTESLDSGQFDDLMQNLLEGAPPGDTGGAANPIIVNGDIMQPLEGNSGGVNLDISLEDSIIDVSVDNQEDEETANTVQPELARGMNAPVYNAFPVPGPEIPGNPPHPTGESDEEPAEELERRQNIAEDEMAVAEAANNNGNIFEVLGLRLLIATPIQLAFMVDSAALLLLFFLYFLPQIFGSFVALVVLYTVIGFEALFFASLARFFPLLVVRNVYGRIVKSRWLENRVIVVFGAVVGQQFVDPSMEVVRSVLSPHRMAAPTYITRYSFLVIGYSVVCFAINQLMAALTLGKGPITGTSRKVYKVLFQITATAKVFAIFAIEIVLFPVYCGWLLDFCVAPLLLTQVMQDSKTGTSPIYHILFTSASQYTQGLICRFVVYWIWGTAYMFCIALFVSMARNHILRAGVLYFIKSPEDPNARLIHDAIVKPFFLQMLRILLSAKVYSGFLVLGIGLITWGLRFLVNPPFSDLSAGTTKGALLPIRHFSCFSLQHGFVTCIILVKAEPVLTKYCRKFWKRSFAVLCHKLRLLHFILGYPVAQERGHVVYRNSWERVLKTSMPDYTNPVSYTEAMEIFRKNPEIKACFVPNGLYIRAPSTDDNSRKFLREIFVPVTKSDQLVAPKNLGPADKHDADAEDTDWWDADVVCEDAYAVVYSPPRMRMRCLALVCMISVFGALVFIVVLLIAIIVGRPVFRACIGVAELICESLGIKWKFAESFDWSYIDVDSLCIGLLAQLAALLAYDAGPESQAVIDLVVQQRFRFMDPPGLNMRGVFGRFLLLMAQKCVQLWFLCDVHLSYIAHLEYRFFENSLVRIDDNLLLFRFTKAGFIMHSLAGLLMTIVPIFTTLSAGIPERGSVRVWVREVGLIKLLISLAIMETHSVYLAFYGGRFPRMENTVSHLFVLGTVIFIRVVIFARSHLEGISEQIKTQKYMRGTAVQNVEATDD